MANMTMLKLKSLLVALLLWIVVYAFNSQIFHLENIKEFYENFSNIHDFPGNIPPVNQGYRYFLLGGYLLAFVVSIHLIVAPLLFKCSHTFRRNLIFLNVVQWPPGIDYGNVSKSGIDGGRSLFINYESKVDKTSMLLGLWHILPTSELPKLVDVDLKNKTERDTMFRDSLKHSKKPIVIYYHGNSNSRGATHRIKLYKFFQSMDFHTITFDYRGYGDSTPINPSEEGVVEDGLIVYEWVLSEIDESPHKPPIYIWGHSLGSGISSNLFGNLAPLSKTLLGRDKSLPLPNGLILEAPFSNLAQEVEWHPMAILVRWIPYFNYIFIDAFEYPNSPSFASTRHLSQEQVSKLPVLILHAKDDMVVPCKVGVMLFEAIKRYRNGDGAAVEMHVFPASENKGHTWICEANGLDDIIKKFITTHGEQR